MHKVIVERPRGGSSWYRSEKTALRLSAADLGTVAVEGDDFDGGPSRPRITRDKRLNENLAPLRRYLEKQVGRPWSKVRGEVVRGVDARSAIGLHVLQHVPHFVETETMIVDGQPMSSGWGGPHPVRRLYVDPRTGLLRDARKKPRRRPAEPRPEPNYLEVSPDEVYGKVDGLWYRLFFRLQEADEPVTLAGGRMALAGTLPGFPHRVVARKLQCDRKTVRKIERGDLGVPEHRP
jgi:hypothetical protein